MKEGRTYFPHIWTPKAKRAGHGHGRHHRGDVNDLEQRNKRVRRKLYELVGKRAVQVFGSC